MKKMQTAAVLAAFLLPATAQAAAVSYTGFDAELFHAGGNVGGFYPTTSIADRTEAVMLSPSGLVQGSDANAYSGNIATALGTRRGAAQTTGETYGLMESDGFFFNSQVSTQTECIETNITGCLPFMRSQADLTFDFTVDVNTTMYLDGSWSGGNEDPATISLVDYLGLSLSRVTIAGATLPLFAGVNTNGAQNGTDAGTITGTVNLVTGTTYRFGFGQRAYAQSVSATGATDSDAGFLTFSASFVETNDVAYYQSRYDTLTAPVPLPATSLMLIAGLGALGAMRRHKRT